jgi:hypothetical protein
MTETCSGCGRAVAGGTAGCRADFDALVGRDFSDARFFASHNLLVDTYALQHPDEFCKSGKSLAAHLCRLCLLLGDDAGKAAGIAAVRAWLDGPRALEKPLIPSRRGATILADLAGIDDPAAWRAALTGWAESTWAAWRDLHPIAGQWIADALASGRSGRSR